MKRLKLILTFDYELPLGSIKKSYGHSLFEPTDKLFEVLHKLQVPSVFFADILSYTMFEKWDKERYALPFKKQLKKAAVTGHDVQLHLHPHWLESNYNNGKIIQSEKYKMGDFANNYPHGINSIIESGICELSKICKTVQHDYKCIAYRAGGYNFVPCAAEILSSLFSNGIRIDSSISRGYFFKSSVSVVDYRNVPNLPHWYLSLNGNFKNPDTENKGILEIPIASKPKGMFEVPTAFKLKKYEHRAVESRGSMIHSNEKVSKRDKVRQLFSSRMLTVDNHTYSPEYLMNILDYNVKKFQSHDTIMLSLIGHPKSMDKYHYQLLAEFVNRARDKYGNSIEFTTFRKIYNELNLDKI
ncbi:MAG: hypothetical protein H8E34_06905 [Bacteroidetes bacterium]|nr:hypothetical protein [Bacteroidota bacterium]MBL6943408.1 hypothetical protein [Bacteroidales bacterium]